MNFDVIYTVLTFDNILWIAFGVLLGYVVGVIPGLGKGTAVAVSIPITFYLSPLTGIAYLIGIAKGSTAGSAVSAILLNTPGEPSSAPTALDGYPMSRQGKASKALKMGLFASVIGDFFSTFPTSKPSYDLSANLSDSSYSVLFKLKRLIASCTSTISTCSQYVPSLS